MKPIIQIEKLTYQHPDTGEKLPPALQDISFTVNEGEMIALVGANGSGKTTLARHMNALLLPTSGRVLVNGMDTRERAHHPRIRSEVGMVFQHPEDQIVATIVEEDVAFGPENLCHLPAAIREEVDHALALVNMGENRRRPPHLLSAGQMQRVALAGVLAMQPSCIIFDETTAMLDPAGRRDVLHRMADLNRMGITVIYITHFMEEVLLTRRALLLEKGRLVFDGTPQQLFNDPALIERTGLEQPAATRFYQAFPGLFPNCSGSFGDLNRLFEAIPAYTGSLPSAPLPNSSEAGEFEIEIRDLSHIYMADTPLAHPALTNISFSVEKGIPHGLVGATGSGKSTLLQHLNGLYRPQQGSIRVGGFNLNDPALDVKALRRYTGLVFQNPELYFFEQYVGDEISYGPRMMLGRDGLRERVQWAMQLVGLDFETFKDRIPSTLSGGEQRKVALAASLAVKPSLLVLDEPTAGLDPHSRQMLLTNLRSLQEEGVQILFSSHNMDDIVSMVQNLTILSKGRTLVTQPVCQVFTDREMLLQAGLEQPSTIRLAQALRYHGWPVSRKAVTLPTIQAEVQRIQEGRPA